MKKNTISNGVGKMSLYIVKRNGKLQQFDKEKIVLAIAKAAAGDEAPYYADAIARKIEMIAAEQEDGCLSVEDIQNLVEEALMDFDKETAKEYIRYRYKRAVARQASSEFIETIREKIEATNVQNQNANVDELSFGGRVGEASDAMMKKYALDYCVSPLARERHLNNEIYIHDLSAYAVGSHNCLSIPFDDLLAKGFNTRQADVRPANSINTAFQLVAVIFQLQSLMQFG